MRFFKVTKSRARARSRARMKARTFERRPLKVTIALNGKIINMYTKSDPSGFI